MDGATRMARWILLGFLWLWPCVAGAQSLFPASAPSSSSASAASLFPGQRSGGFFAPLPAPQSPAPAPQGTGDAPIDQLLSLIAAAEAGPAGYDAVQYGATVRPDKRPTQMTLGEIYAWIEATPGQPHAIGRYQFIPSTLHRIARERGFGPDTVFSPGVQDALALVLLEDAGLSAFEAGGLGRRDFMHNLARIWAGLPLPNGRSYYEGHAGNRATMTWAAFEGGIREIWPGVG